MTVRRGDTTAAAGAAFVGKADAVVGRADAGEGGGWSPQLADPGDAARERARSAERRWAEPRPPGPRKPLARRGVDRDAAVADRDAIGAARGAGDAEHAASSVSADTADAGSRSSHNAR